MSKKKQNNFALTLSGQSNHKKAHNMLFYDALNPMTMLMK
ncbi:hypothetical protein SSCHL_1536 [Staphylococcus schleiferi]|nr:hypothetical protein SSCHL_1536 [Staphylococcus schleiferi]